MEERKLVICPTEDADVIAYENVSVVRGEIRIHEVEAKRAEIAALEARIEDLKARIEGLKSEIEFADRIICAKKAEDERIAAEAAEAVVEEPVVEPFVEQPIVEEVVAPQPEVAPVPAPETLF